MPKPGINKVYKPKGGRGTRLGKSETQVIRGLPAEKLTTSRSSKPPCKGSGGVPIAKGKKRGNSGMSGQKLGKIL